jgi:hypothetical protein
MTKTGVHLQQFIERKTKKSSAVIFGPETWNPANPANPATFGRVGRVGPFVTKITLEQGHLNMGPTKLNVWKLRSF